MMMKIVMIAVLKSKPPSTRVTAKTEPSEMAKDRTVSSTMVKYCGKFHVKTFKLQKSDSLYIIFMGYFRNDLAFLKFTSTFKPVYNNYLWDTKYWYIVVDKWLLFRGHLCNKSFKWGLEIVVVVDKWSLFT
jgi:hypothetical protein